jgi:cardiolipin synthase
MLIKDWKKDLFTIPNLLSLFRLVLIPVYVVIYLNAQDDTDNYIAAGILAVSCLTDAIDGKIARHFNMISTVGKILDPIADKATQFTLIVCLAIRNPVLWILVCLFFIKECFQLIAGLMTLRKGQMLSGALISGKICTTVLFVSLIVLVMMPQLSETVIFAITTLDCVVVLIAFICYARVYYTHSPMIQDLSNKTEE